MTGSRIRPTILIAGLLLGLLAVTLQGVQGEELEKVPSEDQCRPYIEKALKDLGTEGSQEQSSVKNAEPANDNNDEGPGEESATDANENGDKSGSREKRDIAAEEGQEQTEDGNDEEGNKSESSEARQKEPLETAEVTTDETEDGSHEPESEQADSEDGDAAATVEELNEKSTDAEGGIEDIQEEQSAEGVVGDSAEGQTVEEVDTTVVEEESVEQDNETNEIDDNNDYDNSPTDNVASVKEAEEEMELLEGKSEEPKEEEEKSAEDKSTTAVVSAENEGKEESDGAEFKEAEFNEQQAESVEEKQNDDTKEENAAGKNEERDEEEEDKKSIEEEEIVAEEAVSVEQELETVEASEEIKEGEENVKSEGGEKEGAGEPKEVETQHSEEGGDGEGKSEGESTSEVEGEAEAKNEANTVSETEGEAEGGNESEDDEESRPEEEELIMEIEIPEILRPRDHVNQLLKLDEENEEKEKAVEKVSDVVLRDLKKLYDNAIKPLESLYKYRDLSNRHFSDPEIFSKPLVLFMGPWSGGKSSIINYLLDIEYKPTSLRTGAEPSPAYFNIVMHGEEEEVLDGTQLAADWTFSGLQKFGQGLLDRLKGYKLNNKLLEKVNIVEIPGILEIRKQVQRLFPFNDACQWFIDRADIIFLVYDPSKLDVGPETEAILDQLKGREYQTRIILNKADQVKPEELMRVQGALIWNISPLMSSAEPPIMYSTSLWSIPYEAGAPTRLLYAQERAFLRDLRSAVDKRVEHKIASARRFAVRVRNHAKMVDCYLTTYYNHKSFFAKKKDISDRIIENPQDYHIYEGLSTLTNISRYDLPDPDVYRDFFRLNPLYDFPLLSSTCTYFRGCPINRLDVAIAYDLPELVGKYKKSVEAALHQEDEAAAGTTSTPMVQPQKEAHKATAKSGAARISMS